ncbi:MAG: hypothetical protein RLZZ143_3033 [Cyanobacteriota bacterium]|jgi:hypothetical protein
MKNWTLAVAFGTVVATTSIGFISSPATAVPVTKTAGVAVISAGAGLGFTASVVGAPVGAFIGGFQIGWGIGCVLFDPPDTMNAGVPVSIDTYTIYQLPDVQTLYPSTPLSLANELNSYSDIMDSYVANVRAYRASLDRYDGAILIGRPDFASDRLSEANAFRYQALNIANLAVTALPSLLSLIDSLDSSVLSFPVTLSNALTVRDEIGNGNFPANEQFALTAWAVTPLEMTALENSIGNIPDTVLQSIFQELDPVNGNSTTFGNAVTKGTALCSQCLVPVPEPTSILSLLALGTLGAASTLKRQLKPSQLTEKETTKVS